MAVPVRVDDLPLLGEAFAVEFANTRYRSDTQDLDFLTQADTAALWFEHARAAAHLGRLPTCSEETLAALRQVRDATRRLLEHAADGAGVPWALAAIEAAEVLHRQARRAPSHLALELGDGAPSWHLHHDGTDAECFIVGAASRCILFLGGEDYRRVRRCARAACPMLFVQRHRARRFCHEACAHATRQARYYRLTGHRQRSRTIDVQEDS
jgi:predicted RNA-binding Zn ribbon-like protein